MSTSSRDAVARGDILALIETLGPDEIMTIDLPFTGSGTMARIGRTQIATRGDGDIQVHVHETEEDAAECFAANQVRASRLVAAITAAGDNPLAQIMALQRVLTEEDTEDTVPVATPVPVTGRAAVPGVQYVSADPLTGQYL